jgi:Tol biopolymer transport system component
MPSAEPGLPDRFGPFVVVGAVGSGGMGQVYRARDPRLNRDVAIKVLARAGSDPVRQRRFTDEAQAASALNHPNILTVYDVGVHDDVPYIVSELVEGASMRMLLARVPLAVREVLDLAVQMAEGLAAAHQAGIVHRDFKPENVMVTHEGRVKILDFGLALIGTREAAGSPEGDVTLTNTGFIVGTVPYMSPEQARGASVDYRTDQFSLGLTLYEMLTGRRAFRAETAAQTLAAILEDEPESIAKLNPRVPAPLRWAIERCLAKDPRQRYESTTDLARDLRTLRDRVTEVASISDIAPAVAPPRRRRLAGALVLVALAMTGAAGVIVGRGIDPAGARLDRYRFTPFATDAGYQASPAWSPDGKTLAYVAAVDGVLQVFTKAVGSPLRSQVTHSRFDCREVFWGSDGTRLYYISLARDRDGLWSISAVGGEPEFVLENVSRAALSPDGKTLAILRAADNVYAGANKLWFWSPAGSAPAEYRSAPFGERVFFDGIIRFTPDGSTLGMWAIRASVQRLSTRSEFWLIPSNGEAPSVASSVTSDRLNFAAPFSWLPDGRHIVSALPLPRPGVHLWIQDTKSDDRQLITAGGAIENDPAVSPDGAQLASTFQQANYDIFKVSLDRPVLEPVLASSRNEMDPVSSRTSAQMVFTTDRSGADEIWLRSQTGDFERPLVTAQDFPTSETYILGAPALSPDGQRVAYYREGERRSNRIWISPVAGGPPVELAPANNEEHDQPEWSPDGNWIAFPKDSGGAVVGKWSLMKTRVGAKVAAQVVVPDIVEASPVKWSPNGAWIAYNGREGLSIVAPDGQSAHAIYDEPWMAYAWSEDSRRLFGIRPSDDFKHLTLTSIDVATRNERVLQADLLPLPVAARPVRGFTRVSDTTFLTSIVRVSSDIWLFDGFRSAPTFWSQLISRFTPGR